MSQTRGNSTSIVLHMADIDINFRIIWPTLVTLYISTQIFAINKLLINMHINISLLIININISHYTLIINILFFMDLFYSIDH